MSVKHLTPWPAIRTRSRNAARSLTALALTLLIAIAGAFAGVSQATADDAGADPNLTQVIPANQPIVHGNHVISTGHIDMGPRFDNGTWRFLIHDDAHKADANATSVWRYPKETVLQVVDKAKLTVPEDKAYSFVGADPGTTVWVIPQTQNPDVIWAGWNTQDPTVMEKLDRGATFAVDGIQGPGSLVVYLQSGSFGEPQVLWDSRKSGEQPIWVDTNTHTHANWVFTKPGVYLVKIKATATLKDGSKVSDTQDIRFSVGSETSTDDAFAASWQGAAADGANNSGGNADANNSNASSDGGAGNAASNQNATAQSKWAPILVWVFIGLAVVMAIGFTAAIIASNRSRRRILAAVDVAKSQQWVDSQFGSRPSGGRGQSSGGDAHPPSVGSVPTNPRQGPNANPASDDQGARQ